MLMASWAAIAMVAGPAHATFPGANGKLALTMASPRGIGAVNPDGTGLTRLTTAFDDWPAWSADGRHIAFVRFTFERGEELWVMDAEGANPRRVRALAPDSTRGGPTWSLNGVEVAFARFRTGDLEIIDTRDGSSRIIRPSGSPDTMESADWSPDGQEIVVVGRFQEVRCDPPDDPNECDFVLTDGIFYRVAVDGSAITPIPITGTLQDDNVEPSWSPSGAEIAFERGHSGFISIVDANGGTPRELGEHATSPVWSPDGTKLVYGGGSNETFGEIYTINVDGSGSTRILDQDPSTGTGFGRPNWQPISNRPPDCSGVRADPTVLWPPNHKLHTVTLSGATDPDGDAVVLRTTGATSNGPGGTAQPQGSSILLRAERNPRGTTRVYTVAFTVTDEPGASCSGTVRVTVPGPKS